MAMRETVSSIKAYLLLSGTLSALSYISRIASSRSVTAALIGVAGLALSLGYFYIGARFKTLIVTAPSRILDMLKVGAGFLLVILALGILRGASIAALPGVVVGLLVTWYLFVNARRLAGEARQAPVDVTASN